MRFLRRSVRELPAARRLQTQLPRASLVMRLANITQSTASAAACLLVLLAVRTSILSSLDQVEQESVRTVQHLHGYIDELSESRSPGRSKTV